MARNPRSFLLFAALVHAFILACPALAWPPTFGREFNFASPAAREAYKKREATSNRSWGRGWIFPQETEFAEFDRFANEVKKLCEGGECEVTSRKGKWSGREEYVVTFKNGYHFILSVDPGCVEVMTGPETVEEMKANEERTEKFIFEVARRLGFETTGEVAHFNVGLLSAFEGDPKGFLKYFVNYHNYQELASGILGADIENAPPVSHLEGRQRAALLRIVRDVNEGKVATTEEVAKRIHWEVYTKTPYHESARHDQGIGLKYVDKTDLSKKDAPFELRAPRQPKTAHESTLLSELMEKRMAFEKADTGLVAFLDVPKQTDFSDAELSNRFRLYLLEMGADWEYFKELIPEAQRNHPPDAFLSGSVNWASAADLKTLKTYASLIASSAWVRKRMQSLLETPEAVASGKVPEILAAIRAGGGKHSSLDTSGITETSQVHDRFTETVRQKAIPTWASRISDVCRWGWAAVRSSPQ